MKAYIDVAVRNMTTRDPHERAVKEAIIRTLTLTGIRRKVEVSVVMVGERAIRSLEREWKGEDKVTDVLSFRFAEGGHVPALDAGTTEYLGEIVICLPYAYAQAKELGVRGEEHIITLAAHGAIHLSDIDHERSASEARRTEEIQKKIKTFLCQVAPKHKKQKKK
ncbi:MAG: rRNA maturation RNase YbeY [Candidatus Azambacteria bacterium]|nr:rRNA maturation RNase YbeY [Candidatus Azambacteria bacterium]